MPIEVEYPMATLYPPSLRNAFPDLFRISSVARVSWVELRVGSGQNGSGIGSHFSILAQFLVVGHGTKAHLRMRLLVERKLENCKPIIPLCPITHPPRNPAIPRES